MGLRVSGKNFSLGESLRQHVLERIEAARQKFFDGSVQGHVVIDHEGSGYRTDCTLHLASGVSMHAIGFSHEPYASFEQAADRLERRLRRYKNRLKDHHWGQSSDAMVAADYTIETPDDDLPEAAEFHPVVIAEQTRALKSMPVSAAVLELDFTGASMVAFRHATTERVNVVYRRADGNIGWLDPSAEGAAGVQNTARP